MTNGDYIAGDRFSAADVYVGSQIQWGMNMTGMLQKRRSSWTIGRGSVAGLRTCELTNSTVQYPNMGAPDSRTDDEPVAEQRRGDAKTSFR